MKALGCAGVGAGMRGLLMLAAAALLLMAADPKPELTQADATGVLSRMVRDADGKEIGRIVDVVVDPSGQPRAIVVDVGGFMGVGSRRVAVSWSSVHVPPPGAEDKRVGIDLTDAQVRSAPDYTDRSKPAMIVGPPAPAADAPPPDVPKADASKPDEPPKAADAPGAPGDTAPK